MKKLLKYQQIMTAKRNLLDFSYHQNYYKLIGIDLLKYTNLNIPLQVNFKGKVEEDNGGAIFCIAEKAT